MTLILVGYLYLCHDVRLGIIYEPLKAIFSHVCLLLQYVSCVACSNLN
jgi:hypothetical protein